MYLDDIARQPNSFGLQQTNTHRDEYQYSACKRRRALRFALTLFNIDVNTGAICWPAQLGGLGLFTPESHARCWTDFFAVAR